VKNDQPVMLVKNGSFGIDLDALAGHLGMTVRELKDSMQMLSLSYIMDEADRLNSGEHFDKKTKLFPYPPPMDRHVIAAAKSMFRTTTQSIEEV
jgi:hypothetical protein